MDALLPSTPTISGVLSGYDGPDAEERWERGRSKEREMKGCVRKGEREREREAEIKGARERYM